MQEIMLNNYLSSF